MRAKKLAAPTQDLPPPDLSEVFLLDVPDDVGDVVVDERAGAEAMPREGEPLFRDRICLACGGAGGSEGGCEHREIARFTGPSRAAQAAAARLRQAALEHRSAARALRALVMSELARGRAELETAPAEHEAPLSAPPPASCPRCAAREATELLPVGTPGAPGASVAPVAPVARTAPRASRRKARGPDVQQVLPFVEQRPAFEGEVPF